MSQFKIIPMSATVAERIRTTRQDDFGNDVLDQVTTGYGPCRLTLKAFKPGVDRRLLFSYSPFEQEGLYAEKGPVFISDAHMAPYADVHRFPPEIKADPVNFSLSLSGYNADRQMNFTRLVGCQDVDVLMGETLDKHLEMARTCTFATPKPATTSVPLSAPDWLIFIK